MLAILATQRPMTALFRGQGPAGPFVKGLLELFDGMVSGDWSDEDFLVVPPGHRVIEKFDGSLFGIEKARP